MMQKAMFIIFLVILITGCKSIVASSSKDYKYENNAYVRSTADPVIAKQAAVDTCKKNVPFNIQNFIRAAYLRDDKDGIVFSCYLVTPEVVERESKEKELEKLSRIEKEYKQSITEYYRQHPEMLTYQPEYESNVTVSENGIINARTRIGDKLCITSGYDGNLTTSCN
ncbi:TPA: hypothetical protein I8622_005780 [Klebsiella oxytoca]|nr:hypothetical protein [Klebsiella oxytoca]